MSRKQPQVYMDIMIGSKAVGRISFELFVDITPKTAENFRGLCTGEYGTVGLQRTNQKLWYRNSSFHRIIDGFMIQGGDITKNNGTGGASIYGAKFDDENFQRRHASAGLLSMANSGRNSNSSQFFITLRPCPQLDGKHVVFGKVIGGMDIVRKIAKVPVDINSRPKLEVRITESGEIDDKKDFLKYDAFSKENMELMRHANKHNSLAAIEERQDEENEAEAPAEEEAEEEAKPDPEQDDLVIKKLKTEVETNDLSKTSIPESKLNRLFDLKLKMNEARKKNLKAVVEENRLNNNPRYLKSLKHSELDEKQKEKERELEFKGLKNKDYLDKPAIAQFKESKKNTAQVFGWEVFNDDTLYRANDKRNKKMPFYAEVYQRQKESGNEEAVPNQEEFKDRLKDALEEQKAQSQKFSRRRAFDPDEDVNYINERNRKFNLKLKRHFGQYSKEIKTNLENGTALNN